MKRMNEKGAVSMISVVIFTIILLIVVTAYARTIVRQQRESINFDLSTRAYYAAESGVQDAVRVLANAQVDDPNSPLNKEKDTCDVADQDAYPGGVTSDAQLIGYSCILIDPNPSELAATTQQGKTLLFKLDPEGSVNGSTTISFKWSEQKAPDATTSDYAAREDASKLFPSVPNWVNSTAGNKTVYPLVRLSLIRVSNTTPITKNSFKQQVYFLNPTSQSGLEPARFSFANSEDPQGVVQNAFCDAQSLGVLYPCSQSIEVSDFSTDSYTYYAAVQSVYGNADVALSFAGKEFEDTVATIDATGVAAGVYRRVKQTVPISSNGFSLVGLDASALVSGEGICKLFTVGEKTSNFVNECK